MVFILNISIIPLYDIKRWGESSATKFVFLSGEEREVQQFA